MPSGVRSSQTGFVRSPAGNSAKYRSAQLSGTFSKSSSSLSRDLRTMPEAFSILSGLKNPSAGSSWLSYSLP